MHRSHLPTSCPFCHSSQAFHLLFFVSPRQLVLQIAVFSPLPRVPYVLAQPFRLRPVSYALRVPPFDGAAARPCRAGDHLRLERRGPSRLLVVDAVLTGQSWCVMTPCRVSAHRNWLCRGVSVESPMGEEACGLKPARKCQRGEAVARFVDADLPGPRRLQKTRGQRRHNGCLSPPIARLLPRHAASTRLHAPRNMVALPIVSCLCSILRLLPCCLRTSPRQQGVSACLRLLALLSELQEVGLRIALLR